ncbi:MAG: hypothetical protein AAGI23_01755 [Bacteroidota bacterium]
MKVINQLKTLSRVDGLIRRKATGTATQLANRLQVSHRTATRLLEELRWLDAPIQYCSKRRTYYYNSEFDFGQRLLEEL